MGDLDGENDSGLILFRFLWGLMILLGILDFPLFTNLLDLFLFFEFSNDGEEKGDFNLISRFIELKWFDNSDMFLSSWLIELSKVKGWEILIESVVEQEEKQFKISKFMENVNCIIFDPCQITSL